MLALHEMVHTIQSRKTKDKTHESCKVVAEKRITFIDDFLFRLLFLLIAFDHCDNGQYI